MSKSTMTDIYTVSDTILAVANGAYEAIALTISKNDPAAVTIDGRKILKAGTVYPTNDNKAKGIIFRSVDVTDGDKETALLIRGTISLFKIPEKPTSAALTAMGGTIKVLPQDDTFTLVLENQNSNFAVGAGEVDVNVLMGVSNGVPFTDEAITITNWILGGTATGLSIKSVVLSGNKQIATVNITGTGVAGTVTLAGAAIITKAAQALSAITVGEVI